MNKANSPLASIILNNYNYSRFLREAIDSALNQTYPEAEVIVVDDGSTDDSREIIASYAGRIVTRLQQNGGQNSAFNSGFSMSHGHAIFFLDSDDTLLPTAVEAAMEAFREENVAKVHWPLLELDAASRLTGRVWETNHRGPSTLKQATEDIIVHEDARDLLLREGPDAVPYPPTSGNAFSRKFLESVFPLRDVKHDGDSAGTDSEPWRARPGPDVYLSTLAPLYGHIKRLPAPQGCYRLHGRNGYASLGFEDRLRFDAAIFEFVSQAARECCAKFQAAADPEIWKSKSWSHRIRQATQTITALVPRGDAFILVDEDGWGTEPIVAGRRRIPFLEHAGQYWGKPQDAASAIREVLRLRESGAGFMIFAWPAFWWLDYYTELHDYLRTQFQCIHQDERIVVFDLNRNGYQEPACES